MSDYFLMVPDRIDRLLEELNYQYRDNAIRLAFVQNKELIGYNPTRVKITKENLFWVEQKYQALIRHELGESQLLKLKLANKLGYPFDGSIFPDKEKSVLF